MQGELRCMRGTIERMDKNMAKMVGAFEGGVSFKPRRQWSTPVNGSRAAGTRRRRCDVDTLDVCRVHRPHCPPTALSMVYQVLSSQHNATPSLEHGRQPLQEQRAT